MSRKRLAPDDENVEKDTTEPLSKKRKLQVTESEKKEEAPQNKPETEQKEEKTEKNTTSSEACVTLESIKNVMEFDPNECKSRVEVYEKMEEIARALLHEIVVVIKDQLYRFCEFEFYVLDGTHHSDIFAHCDHLQFHTSCQWYFHKAGNRSVEGFHYMRTPSEKRSEWTERASSYRSGSYKGLDITIGKMQVTFGGILIRSIQRLKPMNTLFRFS
ncbi:hypothetical protein RFI_02738 [Reticulomyxa filosa]|uniref:Uncharacterized protein n=1 Tax=Reticulomyxa filosa TaxID=46433 RepID=X6P9P6_RETFI|nr:hypothetical protein RFI_02738 [Reticulomyxa filosa]|eukprot:ETO34357.1 hypothetical protein RFI_02738 [Reticulomyxa filosa]